MRDSTYDFVSNTLQNLKVKIITSKEYTDGWCIVPLIVTIDACVDGDDEDIPLTSSCIYTLPSASIGIKWELVGVSSNSAHCCEALYGIQKKMMYAESCSLVKDD